MALKEDDFRRKLDYLSKLRFRMHNADGELVAVGRKEAITAFAKLAFKNLAAIPASAMSEYTSKNSEAIFDGSGAGGAGADAGGGAGVGVMEPDQRTIGTQQSSFAGLATSGAFGTLASTGGQPSTSATSAVGGGSGGFPLGSAGMAPGAVPAGAVVVSFPGAPRLPAEELASMSQGVMPMAHGRQPAASPPHGPVEGPFGVMHSWTASAAVSHPPRHPQPQQGAPGVGANGPVTHGGVFATCGHLATLPADGSHWQDVVHGAGVQLISLPAASHDRGLVQRGDDAAPSMDAVGSPAIQRPHAVQLVQAHVQSASIPPSSSPAIAASLPQHTPERPPVAASAPSAAVAGIGSPGGVIGHAPAQAGIAHSPSPLSLHRRSSLDRDREVASIASMYGLQVRACWRRAFASSLAAIVLRRMITH